MKRVAKHKRSAGLDRSAKRRGPPLESPCRMLSLVLSFEAKVPKRARGTAATKAAHVARHCGQALRCAWAWLRASWLSAISGASRPSVCGSRTVGCPEFIRGIQFRPLGRNSLTTFRGQTALRGCPRPRFALLTRREKALYCPFLKEGVRNVAHNGVG